jgi:hypothetical protein
VGIVAPFVCFTAKMRQSLKHTGKKNMLQTRIALLDADLPCEQSIVSDVEKQAQAV